MNETDYQQRLIDAAHTLGWMAHHARPARTAKGWRTPVVGDPGFPDLVLSKDGRVIVAELKVGTNQPTAAQRCWLDALGEHGRLWTPATWEAALAELRGEVAA